MLDQIVSKELVEAGHGYESLFVVSLFDVWTKHLVEGARVREGSHVLDVACGTGVLARKAMVRAGANGRVVGVDPAPGMLAVAGKSNRPSTGFCAVQRLWMLMMRLSIAWSPNSA